MRCSVPLLRSAWRGPFVTSFPTLPQAISEGHPIRTDNRSCVILPNFVGVQFEVHNGNQYIPVTINEDMVGHRLGEFAATKKWIGFKDSKKKRK